MQDGIVFDGLDQLRGVLARHAASLDYVTLDEVIHRQKRVQLARVNFSPLDLSDELDALDEEPAEETPDEEDEDVEAEDHEDTGDEPTEPTEPASPLRTASEPERPDPAWLALDEDTRRLCRAVLLWVQGEARLVMKSRPYCAFRLRLHGPKGGYIETQQFRAENIRYRPPRERVEAAPAPAPTPPAAPPPAPLIVQAPPVQVLVPPPPSLPPPEPPRRGPAVAIALQGDEPQLLYLDPDTIPESRVWRALGLATEDLLRRAGAAYGDIIELQSRTVLHQAGQLDRSQALVEQLASRLLDARQVSQREETEQKVDERQLRIREELGKTFLSELGSLGRALASSKLGMAPELLELGDLLSTSPELAEALRDPGVRALLKDDKTRKELAQLLMLASKKPLTDPAAPPRAA